MPANGWQIIGNDGCLSQLNFRSGFSGICRTQESGLGFLSAYGQARLGHSHSNILDRGRGKYFSIVTITTCPADPGCHDPSAYLEYGTNDVCIAGDWTMMITLIWRSALFVLLTAGTTTLMALPYLD